MIDLREARRTIGLTQGELARRAGVSVPTVRALERGEGSLRSMAVVMARLELRWGWVRGDDGAAAGLSARRRHLGLSQSDVAERVGVSRPTVWALERDLSGTVQTLVKVLRVLGLRRILRAATARRGGLAPAPNDPAKDRVMTPPPLAAAIIAHFGERMAGSVLDPAKGQGAFHDQLPPHVERHWCELAEGRDFLEWTEPVDWVMTNPPWSRLREFTQHAMGIAPNVVWLAPLTNLTTRARLRDLDAYGFGIAELVMIDTPKNWPQSGFQLVAAWLRKGHTGGWEVTRLVDGNAMAVDN